jgi:predicted glycoside hydrolase/deacetylase ChbG (UPF0249 family)
MDLETRPAERRIAVCADDFGLDAGVNEAVLALAQQGRISATSCMVGAPQWAAGAPALRACDPATLDVGLHFDLTAHPFDASLRAPLPTWLLRTHLAAVPRAALRQEVEAQLEAFERAMGRPPAHVDGHQHVHQFPGVRDALLGALEARYGAARPWLRSTRLPPGAGFGKARVIAQLGGAGLQRAAKAKGYLQNGHLLGVYDFRGDAARYLGLLRGWLQAAVDGDLVMCHPGARAQDGDPIAAARLREYAVWCAPALGRLLAEQGVRITRLDRDRAASASA